MNQQEVCNVLSQTEHMSTLNRMIVTLADEADEPFLLRLLAEAGNRLTLEAGSRQAVHPRLQSDVEAKLAFLQLILDELPGCACLVRGEDARLAFANRAAASLWGASWPQDQPMSAFLTEHSIHISRSDGRPLKLSEMAALQAVRRGEVISSQQEVIRRADGTLLPTLVSAVPLNPGSLKLLDPLAEMERTAIVLYQDVSSLKEAERLKDDFIGIAAHELRNPLTILKTYTQLLLQWSKRSKETEINGWQMQALKEINIGANRLATLVDDLLDVTSLQTGGLIVHNEPTDLIALTRRVTEQLQITTDKHTLSLEATLPALTVSVDPGRMEQVLSNVIDNAIKYNPQGGTIKITIRTRHDAEVVISIEDHGIGIPPHEQSRIFERFARAANTSAYNIKGTGLGLYLCRQLVERQAGHIWFESTLGQGTTFFIALPLDPGDNTF